MSANNGLLSERLESFHIELHQKEEKFYRHLLWENNNWRESKGFKNPEGLHGSSRCFLTISNIEESVLFTQIHAASHATATPATQLLEMFLQSALRQPPNWGETLLLDEQAHYVMCWYLATEDANAELAARHRVTTAQWIDRATSVIRPDAHKVLSCGSLIQD